MRGEVLGGEVESRCMGLERGRRSWERGVFGRRVQSVGFGVACGEGLVCVGEGGGGEGNGGGEGKVLGGGDGVGWRECVVKEKEGRRRGCWLGRG